MAIVHIHIERTGGIALQQLYSKKYPGPEMVWYGVRDTLFAPFTIRTANYTEDWHLKLYALLAAHFPRIRHLMLRVRAWRRRQHSIKPEDLAKKAELVIGHFAAAQMLPYLPTGEHSYRTVVREPLDRMWSHYSYWLIHKGDVGHRAIPQYRADMSFEEFSLSPEMHNYQTQAVGPDITIYEYIGTTDQLEKFTRATGLLGSTDVMPRINHFSKPIPDLSPDFLATFKKVHAADYALYAEACQRMARL